MTGVQLSIRAMVGSFPRRVWNSPVLTTWASFATRPLSLVLLWPLVLTRLTTEDVALWLFFSTISALALLMDLGFTPTMSRLVAYGMGGADASQFLNLRSVQAASPTAHPNWNTIRDVCAANSLIFKRLALATLVLVGTVGTASAVEPVSRSANLFGAWAAWMLLILSTSLMLFGRSYAAYLEGTNHIALVRRWDALMGLGALFSSVIALYVWPDLFLLVAVGSAWSVATVLRNRWLARRVLGGRFARFGRAQTSHAIWEAAWPSAWRSAIGIGMSRGLMQGTGVIYAQLSTAAELATYLLALRFILMVALFSQAPFYTRIPTLARLWAQRNVTEQIRVATAGMFWSHLVYACVFIALSLGGPIFFEAIGSNVQFPDPLLWGVLGAAMFAERYGAMHIQLYSTTNHIVWHIATGVTGVIWVAAAITLFPFIGVLAFPIAFLTGYVSFYAWYSARLSYTEFGLSFVHYEARTTLLPLSLLVLYCLASALANFVSSPLPFGQ